jgi:thymidine kinase
MSSTENQNPKFFIYSGPMYSGKSTALFHTFQEALKLNKTIQAIKPNIDKRYSENSIFTHSKKEIPAKYVANLSLNLPQEEWKHINFGADVILIDEIQFFRSEIIDFIKRLLNIGKEIYAAGLDLDSKGNPFGEMPTLMALANKVIKFEGICKKCGNTNATRTYRKLEIDNKDQILIGGEDIYECRCYNCWKL